MIFNRPQMKVRTVNDVYQNELVMGSTGAGIGAYTYPKALSGLLGLKFKIILGFRSSGEMILSMERGEIDGYFASLDSVYSLRPDWIPNNQVTLLFQGGAAPNPTLKNVPFVADLARTPDEKAAIEFLYAGLGLSRPFIAPPDMPADRVKMLQDGFMATMNDPEFIADATKQKLDMDPRAAKSSPPSSAEFTRRRKQSSTGSPRCRSDAGKSSAELSPKDQSVDCSLARLAMSAHSAVSARSVAVACAAEEPSGSMSLACHFSRRSGNFTAFCTSVPKAKRSLAASSPARAARNRR